MMRRFPALLVRFFVWTLMHSVCRMTVVGRGNVPKAGGALLVSNTISFVDHALILAALKRPVRLFMGREFYLHPLIHPFARAVDAIPISNTDSPKAIGAALKEARRAIRNGELVCIFAEGTYTRTGNMLPFGRGFEFIMRGLEAPIIPMHLYRIWGSTFSVVNGRLRWRLPKILPYPVTISFGRRMPARARSHEVRLAVQELSTLAFKLRGKSQQPLHVAFIREAKRHPFRFCMADSLGAALTYGKALAGMRTLSWRLFPERNGEPPEEKVGILLPTSCVAALVNGAVLMAGKIPVNLNYTASNEIINECARQCSMRTIITSHAFLEKVPVKPEGDIVYLEDVKKTIPPLRQLGFFLSGLLLPPSLVTRWWVRGNRSDSDALATVIFSSGSTGEPKGVMLSHQNISSNVESAYQVFNLRSCDVLMGVLPFFHSFGYTATIWFPLLAGKAVVYHTNPLEANVVGDMVRKYRATLIMGTPTFLGQYARKCTREQFATLRFVVAGAEKLRRATAEEFATRFGVLPFEGYGCTELSPIVSLGIPSYVDPEGKFVQVGNKPGTVGHPMPGIAAKIVHPETGKTCAPCEEGLLLIKGPNVMKGYLNRPDMTVAVLRDGWYSTGDIAALDEDGFIAITDRLSRFSKIGGEMVPHIKIEEEIHAVLGGDGPACVVTTMPDHRKGEKLVVLYKGDLDVEALWEKLNTRGLPRLWIPKKEHFFPVEEFPLLGTGKLDLKKLRQLACECTGAPRE